MALAQDLQAFGGGVEVLDVGGRGGVAALRHQQRVDGLLHAAAPSEWPEMDLVELIIGALAKDFAHRAEFGSVAHGGRGAVGVEGSPRAS